ncbi:MAG: diguanylate cyclase [Desulfovibrionaceae bacterium]
MVPEVNPKNVSILIVEDSPTQALQLQCTLEEHGFKCAAAANGMEALAMLPALAPDIVISDIVMPEMSGHQLCRTIRGQEATRDLPVILLTNLSDPEDVIEGLTCGANSYVTKPFDTHFLLSRIHYILANLQLRRTDQDASGMEILFKGRMHRINLNQVHAIDLLLSTFESAVLKNKELEEANIGLLEKKQALTLANMALHKEVEECKEAQRALQASEERYRAIVEDQTEFVCRFHPNGSLTFLNTACARHFHPARGTAPDVHTFHSHFHLDDLGEVQQQIATLTKAQPTAQFEVRAAGTNGNDTLWCQWTVRGFFDDAGQAVEYQAVGQDISSRKETEKRIRHMALHDTLTGLPNRILLMDRLRQAVLEAKRYKTLLAVLFVDLDHFKPINDTLGHEVGDAVLRQVATRLRRELRSMDTVARFGGDEFVVVLQNIETREAAERVATKCIDALCTPFEACGTSCRLSASIGISVFPDHGEDEDTLLKAADQAMYTVKHAGKCNYCIATKG